jgi:hypothetical protein
MPIIIYNHETTIHAGIASVHRQPAWHACHTSCLTTASFSKFTYILKFKTCVLKKIILDTPALIFYMQRTY